jgi:hypothetical protein
LIAKRRAEQQAGGDISRKHPSQHSRQVIMYTVDSFVNLDDIIDYTVFHHGIHDSVGDIVLDNNDSHKEDTLVTYMAARAKHDTHPGNFRRVLGSSHAPSRQMKKLNLNEVQNTPDSVTVGDVKYYLNKGETIAVNGQHYSAHMAFIQYCIGQHNITELDKALVDRGANGGICGADMLVLEGSERFVDVSGLAGHKVNQLRIVTAQALITTHKGEAIATFHQIALLGKGKSILSCIQMESHGADINEKTRLLPGGKQRIIMDDYQIPLDINNGLAYLRCRPPTTHELETLPHIIMTADVNWNPSIFDNDIDNVETFLIPTMKSFTMDPLISMGSTDIARLRSTTQAVNRTSLMRLSSLTMMTWLMTCLTYGSLTLFAVYTA